MRARGLTALVAAAVTAGTFARAEGEGDACALMSRTEFEALTERPDPVDPLPMTLSGGTICAFSNGHIMLLTGVDSGGTLDQLLASLSEAGPRTEVEGLGGGAFTLFPEPEADFHPRAALVVFGARPPIVLVSVHAPRRERGESVLGQAMAVAKAVAAKLPQY
jgi:hypothetical protein